MSETEWTASRVDRPRKSNRRAGERPPLSSGQNRLWFLDQLVPGSSAYNVTDMVRIHGPLQVSALRQALDAIVARHEVLRTTYVSEAGVPVLRVTDDGPEFSEVDLSLVPGSERVGVLAERLSREAARPFDLSKDCMLRAVLFRMDADEFVLFHNSHHIAWDLRSKFVFYDELEVLYDALAYGRTPELPDLPLQYSDYAEWERSSVTRVGVEGLTTYWKQQLQGAALSLRLPTDFARPESTTYRAGPKVRAVLDEEMLGALAEMQPPRDLPVSRALLWRGIAPFHILLTAFNVLMHAYSAQEDILVSSPYSNRDFPELRNLIGFFPNTLILRSRVTPLDSFRNLAAFALDTVYGAVTHAALPFDNIIRTLQPVRRAGHLPLVQVNFRIQKTPVPELHLRDLDVDLPTWVDNGASKFDLALELVMTPKLAGYFEYSAELFREETIRNMALDLQALLRGMIAEPDAQIGDLAPFRTIRSRVEGKRRGLHTEALV